MFILPTANFQPLQPNVLSMPMQLIRILSTTTWWHPQPQITPTQQPFQEYPVYSTQYVPSPTANQHHILP